MIKVIIASVCAISIMGCSHNSALLMMGKKASIGVDPQTYTVNAQYMDGLALGDVSRENSEWELSIDDNAGVSYDSKTGTLKGVKQIRRKLGPQISGYMVDLADKDPESVRKYMEAVKAYWEYKANEHKGKSEEGNTNSDQTK